MAQGQLALERQQKQSKAAGGTSTASSGASIKEDLRAPMPVIQLAQNSLVVERLKPKIWAK